MIRIDFEAAEIAVAGPEGEQRYALASPEGFALLSEAWLRSGWANRYSYAFTWFGMALALAGVFCAYAFTRLRAEALENGGHDRD